MWITCTQDTHTEEDIGVPGTGVACGCELPNLDAVSFLMEEQVLLTTRHHFFAIKKVSIVWFSSNLCRWQCHAATSKGWIKRCLHPFIIKISLRCHSFNQGLFKKKKKSLYNWQDTMHHNAGTCPFRIAQNESLGISSMSFHSKKLVRISRFFFFHIQANALSLCYSPVLHVYFNCNLFTNIQVLVSSR